MNQAENIMSVFDDIDSGKTAGFFGEIAAGIMKSDLSRNQVLAVLAVGTLATMAIIAKQV